MSPGKARKVIADEECEQPESIVQFFRESPLFGLDIQLSRDQDLGRDIRL